MRKWILLCIITGCISCGRSRGKDAIIPTDSMKLIMWDLVKADEWFARMVVKDTGVVRRKEDVKLYEQVFKIHGVTRERFFKSYRYYEGHPLEYKLILDSLETFSARDRVNRLMDQHHR